MSQSRRPKPWLQLETLEDRLTPATISWTGAGANNLWHNADNWDLNRTPDVGDDVVIDIQGKPTIVYNSGTTTVHSITSKESLRIQGGALSATDGFTVQNADFFYEGGSVGGTVVLAKVDLTLATANAGTFRFKGIDNTLVGNIRADHTIIVQSENKAGAEALLFVKDDVHVAGKLRLVANTATFYSPVSLAVKNNKSLTVDAGGTLEAESTGEGAVLLGGVIKSAGTIDINGALAAQYIEQLGGVVKVPEDEFLAIINGGYNFQGGKIDGTILMQDSRLAIAPTATDKAHFLFRGTQNFFLGNVSPKQSLTIQATNTTDGHASLYSQDGFINAGRIRIESSQGFSTTSAYLGIENGPLTNAAGGEIEFIGGFGFLDADLRNGGDVSVYSGARVGRDDGSADNSNRGFIRLYNNSVLQWKATGPVNESDGIISGAGKIEVPGGQIVNHGIVDLINATQPNDPNAPVVLDARRLTSSLTVTYFSAAGMKETTVEDAANYVIKTSGGDGFFNDGNETVLTPSDIHYDLATGLTTLNFSQALPDDAIQLTVVSTNIKDKDTDPLLAQAATPNQHVVLFSVTLAANVTVDLQTASDSGQSTTDNVTNDATPTFDVTVNGPGTIEIDWTGDGVSDLTRHVETAGTYALTTGTLADGVRTIKTRFTPTLGAADQATLEVTIDTVAPQLKDNEPSQTLAFATREVRFSEAIDAATISTNDTLFRAPNGDRIGITNVTGSGSAFTMHFSSQTANGAYRLRVNEGIKDIAGNAIDVQGRRHRFVANHAPEFDTTNILKLPLISRTVQKNEGILVRDLLASGLGDAIRDDDAHAKEGIVVVGVNSTHGKWQYSLDNGNHWRALKNVSELTGRLLAANGGTRVRFVPDDDFAGVVDPGLTFRAWDRTAGRNGERFLLEGTGGATAFSAGTMTASVQVTDLPII